MECPKKDIEAVKNVCQRSGKEVRSESRVLEYMIIKEECTKKKTKNRCLGSIYIQEEGNKEF